MDASRPPERASRSHLQLLRELTEAVAVSGDEEAVRSIVRREIEALGADCREDALGNLLVTRRASRRKRLRIMVSAHMDEVGLIVVAVESDGTLRFEAVGKIDPRQLLGRPVWIGKERIPGVIGAKPVHLATADERKRTVEIDAMRIDLGFDTKEATQAKVKPADRATFASGFVRLGPTIRAKALDNRLGVAILLELLRYSLPEVEIVAAFTVQEEVGLRGAGVAAYSADPDAAIVVDCTPANDLPTWDGSENTAYNARLGAGPAVYVADGGTISDPRLLQHVSETAEAEGIPYQIRQPGPGSTDAGAIHLEREGIPSISISVPARYLHTAAGIFSLSDWRGCARLVHASLSRMKPGTLKPLS